MPRNGHRHLLIVYKYMLDRWWKATLAIGIVLLVMAFGLGGISFPMPRSTLPAGDAWTRWGLVGTGGFAILFTIFLISIRKLAYVQVFGDHLRLVTPFLHLNISHKRIRRTYCAEMGQLFPLKKMGAWKRELLRPLAAKTVLVLELTGFPVSQAALRLFVSPFFFPDKTACLALLVPDWIALSTELESRRVAWKEASYDTPEMPGSNLLSSLTE